MIEQDIKRHAAITARQFCSQLFDAAQQTENPQASLEIYITTFVKTIIFESMKLSSNKEEFLDKINPL